MKQVAPLRLPRRLTLAAVSCTVLSLSAWGQQQTINLRGVVLDAVTHQPIARVLVESPGGGSSVLTDNSGHFSFAAVPLGTVQLRYRRPGYFGLGSSDQTNASTTLNLTATSSEQVLLLQAAATLHGQVLLSDGDLPSGLRVDLYRARVTDGRRSWRLLQTITTRADGTFMIDDLQAGSYVVHAQASLDPLPPGVSGPDGTPHNRSGYAPLFALATGDIRAATVYELRSGQVSDVRLRLARVVYYPVSVRVSGEAARSFQITGNGFSNWTPRYQREDDSLETELPSGNYLLQGSSGGGQAAYGVLTFHVDGAAVAGPSVTMSAAPDMRVETEVIAGSTSSGTAQQANPHVPYFTFTPTDSPDTQPTTQAVQYEDSSGNGLVRRGLPPGDYWVTPGETSGYVSALTSGSADLLSQPLSILPGTSSTLLVTIRQDGGTVSVTRAGDLLSQPGLIQLIPLTAGGVSRTSSSSASSTAPVEFSGLPPGDYLVLATASATAIAFREPGVLQQLTGVRVSVAAGSAAQATLSTFFASSPGIAGSL